MKTSKLTLAVLLGGAFLFHAAQAADAPGAAVVEAAKPDNEFTANLGLTTDYRFRGISQSKLNPAIQGGADYTNNPTGFYAGTWLSSIRWITDVGGSGNLEWDVYGGKRGTFANDFSYDVGVLGYIYPSNKLSTNATTTEVYGQIGYKMVTLKYSHSVSNLFGFPDSKNSKYIDLSGNIPMPHDITLGLHVGHQTVAHSSQFSYTDWKIGLSKDMIGVTWSLAAVGTNADSNLYVTSSGKFTGKTGLVLTATKNF